MVMLLITPGRRVYKILWIPAHCSKLNFVQCLFFKWVQKWKWYLSKCDYTKQDENLPGFFFRIKIRHPFIHSLCCPIPGSWLGLAATWDSGKGWKWMERIFYRILCYFCICTVLVSLILLSTKNRVKTAQTVSLYHGRKKLYFEATAQNMHSFCNLLDNLWYTDHEIGSLIIVFSSIKRTKLI